MRPRIARLDTRVVARASSSDVRAPPARRVLGLMALIALTPAVRRQARSWAIVAVRSPPWRPLHFGALRADELSTCRAGLRAMRKWPKAKARSSGAEAATTRRRVARYMVVIRTRQQFDRMRQEAEDAEAEEARRSPSSRRARTTLKQAETLPPWPTSSSAPRRHRRRRGSRPSQLQATASSMARPRSSPRCRRRSLLQLNEASVASPPRPRPATSSYAIGEISRQLQLRRASPQGLDRGRGSRHAISALSLSAPGGRHRRDDLTIAQRTNLLAPSLDRGRARREGGGWRQRGSSRRGSRSGDETGKATRKSQGRSGHPGNHRRPRRGARVASQISQLEDTRVSIARRRSASVAVRTLPAARLAARKPRRSSKSAAARKTRSRPAGASQVRKARPSRGAARVSSSR